MRIGVDLSRIVPSLSQVEISFEDPINALSLSPHGSFLAVSIQSKHNSLYLINPRLPLNENIIKIFQEPHGGSQSLTFSPDEEILISGSTTGFVSLYKTADLRLVLAQKIHSMPVLCMNFLYDGSSFASCGGDRFVRVWNIRNRMREKVFKAEETSCISCVNSTPDGNHIAAGCLTGAIILWDINGTKLYTLKSHAGLVNALVFSLDSAYIVSAGKDGTIMLHNRVTGEVLKTVAETVTNLAFLENTVLITAGTSLKLWNIFDQKVLHEDSEYEGLMTHFTTSSDGSLIAFAGEKEPSVLVKSNAF